jgi:hypothetical protein
MALGAFTEATIALRSIRGLLRVMSSVASVEGQGVGFGQVC